jgi:hypothetical protein
MKMKNIKTAIINVYVEMAGNTDVVLFDKQYSKAFYIPVRGLEHESLKELIELEYYDVEEVNDTMINEIISAIKSVALQLSFIGD